MQNFNFLFVESEDQINFLTSQIIELDNLPIKAHYEKDPLAALRYLQNSEKSQFPDVIIANNTLCFMAGMEFAESYFQKFYHSNPDTQFYLTANFCSSQMTAKVINMPKIAGFIAQPFSKKIFLEQIVPNIYVSVL